MNLKQLLRTITPDAYENLKYAVETGRWPNGVVLTPEQRELCLQAVIAYDLQHHEEPDRVGFIDRGRKAKLGRDPAPEWQNLELKDAPKN